MKLVTDRKEAIRIESRGSRREMFYDLVLDDGTHLPETVAIDGHAVALIIGGQTGTGSFSEVPQLRGRSILHPLRLRFHHRLPIPGDLLRALWLWRKGIETKDPEWRPRL